MQRVDHGGLTHTNPSPVNPGRFVPLSLAYPCADVDNDRIIDHLIVTSARADRSRAQTVPGTLRWNINCTRTNGTKFNLTPTRHPFTTENSLLSRTT